MSYICCISGYTFSITPWDDCVVSIKRGFCLDEEKFATAIQKLFNKSKVNTKGVSFFAIESICFSLFGSWNELQAKTLNWIHRRKLISGWKS